MEFVFLTFHFNDSKIDTKFAQKWKTVKLNKFSKLFEYKVHIQISMARFWNKNNPILIRIPSSNIVCAPLRGQDKPCSNSFYS